MQSERRSPYHAILQTLEITNSIIKDVEHTSLADTNFKSSWNDYLHHLRILLLCVRYHPTLSDKPAKNARNQIHSAENLDEENSIPAASHGHYVAALLFFAAVTQKQWKGVGHLPAYSIKKIWSAFQFSDFDSPEAAHLLRIVNAYCLHDDYFQTDQHNLQSELIAKAGIRRINQAFDVSVAYPLEHVAPTLSAAEKSTEQVLTDIDKEFFKYIKMMFLHGTKDCSEFQEMFETGSNVSLKQRADIKVVYDNILRLLHHLIDDSKYRQTVIASMKRCNENSLQRAIANIVPQLFFNAARDPRNPQTYLPILKQPPFERVFQDLISFAVACTMPVNSNTFVCQMRSLLRIDPFSCFDPINSVVRERMQSPESQLPQPFAFLGNLVLNIKQFMMRDYFTDNIPLRSQAYEDPLAMPLQLAEIINIDFDNILEFPSYAKCLQLGFLSNSSKAMQEPVMAPHTPRQE